MKRIINIFLIITVGILFFSSCSFLDVVPDEKPTEKDALKESVSAERYLYSCYSFIPNQRFNANTMDLLTGDEVVTPFEHEDFGKFAQGNYTAVNPQISYWNTLFGGIKQTYHFLDKIDEVPQLDEGIRKDYKAQCKFLIAYYHFLLLRCYGPIILVNKEIPVDQMPEDFQGRVSYDECVQWISKLLDEATLDLPAKRSDTQRVGLATSVAAKSMKSRMLLFAASPLFNGNSEDYFNFKSIDGEQLLNLDYKPEKWELAKTAAMDAIELAESEGHRLYSQGDAAFADAPEPTDPIQRILRFSTIDKASKETLWIDARGAGGFCLQKKSRPSAAGSWNGVSPTLAMLDRFYTKNGLPIDKDPEFDISKKFDVVEFSANDSIYGEGETTYLNKNREPRYYAWISFHGGYYEAFSGVQKDKEPGLDAYWPSNQRGVYKKKLLTKFTKEDNCGVKSRVNNFSPTGFLNKKNVHPKTTTSAKGTVIVDYPWVLFRLAELYLNYAEACVETGDNEQAILYLDKIRVRAGIPPLKEAWATIGVTSFTKEELRDIVRQERMIELYLEGHNFWDLRRWKMAEACLGVQPQGLNIFEEKFADFSKKRTLDVVRKFVAPTQYLMPIPFDETQVNSKLVQNPGY